MIRAKPVDMAVVDPLLGGGTPRPHGIERLRQFFPSLPLLVYTELAPATAGVLLELGRAGIRRVVVHRFEDAPGSLCLDHGYRIPARSAGARTQSGS